MDTPRDIQLYVNEACFALGVPYVSGGLMYSTLAYWSVWPGRSACWLCLQMRQADEWPTVPPALREPPLIAAPTVNRATGPAVQLLAGLVGLEIMRLLTGMEAPVALAAYRGVELADGVETTYSPWARHPDCPLCRGAGRVGDPR